MARKPGFKNPSTLSDNNEFQMPPLPVYLTLKEFIACGITLPIFYILSGIFFGAMPGSGLIQAVVTLIGCGLACVHMSRIKQGKPQSWLWDIMYSMGMEKITRGMMKYENKLYWIYAFPIPRPSPYISGGRKPGRELTIHQPWQVYSPPVNIPFRIMKPRTRVRIEVGRGNSVAPEFMHGSVGWERTVSPTIPVRWTKISERSETAIRG
jgi:hypothetical protein